MIDEKKLIEELEEDKNSVYSDIFKEHNNKEDVLQAIKSLINLQPQHDLKKEGLKWIEESIERIKEYKKNNKIDIIFYAECEVSGGIDILYTLGIINSDEYFLLHKKACDLVYTVENDR